jgi:uncharacterized membrane protein YagU involved in acid resistance
LGGQCPVCCAASARSWLPLLVYSFSCVFIIKYFARSEQCNSCQLWTTELIGAKLVLGIPLFLAALLSLATPFAAKNLGYGAVLAVRILLGMCEVRVYQQSDPFL